MFLYLTDSTSVLNIESRGTVFYRRRLAIAALYALFLPEFVAVFRLVLETVILVSGFLEVHLETVPVVLSYASSSDETLLLNWATSFRLIRFPSELSRDGGD